MRLRPAPMREKRCASSPARASCATSPWSKYAIPGLACRSICEPACFEPFGASTRKDGAGLGLAIAKELANAMGGDVALADSGPGGSIFAITLRNAPRSE
ncbi:MAG: ATP-binding protein [Alphaproteobacteria bacterium]